MTGPDHYTEAERWAREAAEAWSRNDYGDAEVLAAIGQVHATLAAAAATALHTARLDVDAWGDVAGTKLTP